jgi:hypothetical protein
MKDVQLRPDLSEKQSKPTFDVNSYNKTQDFSKSTQIADIKLNQHSEYSQSMARLKQIKDTYQSKPKQSSKKLEAQEDAEAAARQGVINKLNEFS